MAGTRLYIITSFILPLLLYVTIICFGYGFFHHHHQNHHHLPSTQQQQFKQHDAALPTQPHALPKASLLWKRMTDSLWIQVMRPILIHSPFHQRQAAKMMHECGFTTTRSSLFTPSPPTIIFLVAASNTGMFDDTNTTASTTGTNATTATIATNSTSSTSAVLFWERIITELIAERTTTGASAQPQPQQLQRKFRVIDNEQICHHFMHSNSRHNSSISSSNHSLSSIMDDILMMNDNYSDPSSDRNSRTFVILCELSQLRNHHQQLQIISDSIAIYYYSYYQSLLAPSSSSTTSTTTPQSNTDRIQLVKNHLARTVVDPLMSFHSSLTNFDTRDTVKRSHPDNNNNDTMSSCPHCIDVILVYDQSVLDWKEYMVIVQNWINDRNRIQQEHDTVFLSTLCRIGPIQLVDMYRSDLIRNVTTTKIQDDSHRNRYILTTNSSIVDFLSNIVMAGGYDESRRKRSTPKRHIILYVPHTTTYFVDRTNNDANETATTVSLHTLSDNATTTTSVNLSSYFSIVNHIDTISAQLDTIVNLYYLNCLNVVADDMPVLSSTSTFTATSQLYDNPTNSISKASISTSFYVKRYYHRAFYLWYQSQLDRIKFVCDEILVEQQRQQTSIHSVVYAPWSTVPLIIPIQLKVKELVEHIVDPKSSSSSVSSSSHWIYSMEYEKTYRRLQQFEESIQVISDAMDSMEHVAKHSSNGTTIIDLDVVIFDLPMEQYLAIFGPLVFPLLIPLLITLIREYIRHRKRRRKTKATKLGKGKTTTINDLNSASCLIDSNPAA